MTAVMPSLPVVQAVGTSQSGTGALTIAWPAGQYQTGDLGVLVVCSQNEANTLSTSAGFVESPNSPQNSGGAGLLARLSVFACPATSGSMTSPVLAAQTLVRYARIYVIRGGSVVLPAVTAGGVNGTGTAVTVTGGTALSQNCLVAAIVAYADATTTPQLSGWTNSNLGSITQQGDESVIGGVGIGLATGTLAAGGAVGNTTATLATSSNWAAMSIVIQPTWMIDASSGIAIPQSSGEWTSFLAAANISIAAPDALHLLQEASGSPADSIGSFPLTAVGSPGYRNAVTGWSTKGISFTDGSTQSLSSTSASLPDPASQSMAILALYIVDSAPAATRGIIGIGTTNIALANITTTPRLQARVVANTATGTVDPTGSVRPYLDRYNFTASKQSVLSDQERLSPTWGASSGKRLRIGGNNTTPTSRVLYSATWFTANSEALTDDVVHALYVAMGFTVSWGAIEQNSEMRSDPAPVPARHFLGEVYDEVLLPPPRLQDEDFWISGVPPVVAAAYVSQLSLEIEDLPAGRLFGEFDEDFWVSGVAPVVATSWQRLPLGDQEELPSGVLYGEFDEDFWISGVAPVVSTLTVNLARLDPDEVPAATLHGGIDEDFWISGVAPVVAAAIRDLATLDRDNVSPRKPPAQDEDFWISGVAPVQATLIRRHPEVDPEVLFLLGFKLNSKNFFEWWPLQRTHVQITQQDGTITYAEIQSAVDNGDGTVTVGMSVVLSGSPITLISWLELCRFEYDDIEVAFSGLDFKMKTTARVVQQ